MIVAASATIARIAPTKTIATASPRLATPCSCTHVDGRVERGREEHRDEDPDQDAARRLDDLDQHDGREDDSEHDQDRARAEADETLLHRREPTEGRGRRS